MTHDLHAILAAWCHSPESVEGCGRSSLEGEEDHWAAAVIKASLCSVYQPSSLDSFQANPQQAIVEVSELKKKKYLSKEIRRLEF